MTKKKLNLLTRNSKNQDPAIINEVIARKSSQIIHIIGYAILGLVFLDYIELFVPPKFFDPAWELDTIGRLIETAWAPLLGFVLIFYRRTNDWINPGELKILSLLSQLALILGIFYLLTVPLLISDAIRIKQSDRAQFSKQIDLQNQQAQQIEQRLNQISEEQFNRLLQVQGQQIPDLQSSSTEELKEKLFTKLQENRQVAKNKLTTVFSQRKQSLLKSTVKWAIGGIIVGVSLISIWKYTNWSKKLLLRNQN